MAKKKVFSIGSALSQGLEETIESAQNYSSELRVDVIPIKKIELDPSKSKRSYYLQWMMFRMALMILIMRECVNKTS